MNGTAVIDWLSFTFSAWPDVDILKMVRLWLREWMQTPTAGIEGNGLYGFEKSVTLWGLGLECEEVVLAVIAWGGKNQRGKVYVSINGSGCSLIKDWGCVRRILETINATITRCDVAVDAMNGEFTVEDCPKWYEEKGFTAGGRRPTYKVEGDWFAITGAGRTFYVGRRENGKYARVYEKGKQLGDRWSVWNRFEVEIHNHDREIPHDIVTNPSAYFAGCYPICEGLVDVGAARIRTLREEAAISLDRLKSYCRIAYGKLIHVLRVVRHQDDESKLLDELALQGVPRRLEKVSLQSINFGASAAPPIDRGESHG